MQTFLNIYSYLEHQAPVLAKQEVLSLGLMVHFHESVACQVLVEQEDEASEREDVDCKPHQPVEKLP